MEKHLERSSKEPFAKIVLSELPLIADTLAQTMTQINQLKEKSVEK
jgi:hypothetical protein